MPSASAWVSVLSFISGCFQTAILGCSPAPKSLSVGARQKLGRSVEPSAREVEPADFVTGDEARLAAEVEPQAVARDDQEVFVVVRNEERFTFGCGFRRGSREDVFADRQLGARRGVACGQDAFGRL